MDLRLETQQNEVGSEVEALYAVVRPILRGVLYALRKDVIDETGGYEGAKLKMLPRLYRRGDGDCGICFEYAVHDAMRSGDANVLERVEAALGICNVPGSALSSILFGAEKTGSQQLIETASEELTPESVLLYGSRGRPAKLQRHLASIASALRKPGSRDALPQSISGIWKADLFIGMGDTDKWVGTTVKINASQLAGARGLRVGVVPVRQGETDKPFKDARRNLVVCPLLHDGDFMETFYAGWGIVQQFIAADARLPKEVALHRPADREVAAWLADRREYPIIDVLNAMDALAQPELLATKETTADVVLTRGENTTAGAAVAPVARTV